MSSSTHIENKLNELIVKVLSINLVSSIAGVILAVSLTLLMPLVMKVFAFSFMILQTVIVFKTYRLKSNEILSGLVYFLLYFFVFSVLFNLFNSNEDFGYLLLSLVFFDFKTELFNANIVFAILYIFSAFVSISYLVYYKEHKMYIPYIIAFCVILLIQSIWLYNS